MIKPIYMILSRRELGSVTLTVDDPRSMLERGRDSLIVLKGKRSWWHVHLVTTDTSALMETLAPCFLGVSYRLLDSEACSWLLFAMYCATAYRCSKAKRLIVLLPYRSPNWVGEIVTRNIH